MYAPSLIELSHYIEKFSQHGQPLEIVHIGETAIDQDTFNEYLSEMTEHYTADKVCHSSFLFLFIFSTLSLSIIF